MKIYGGHDYYDCGLALGQDPAIVLQRFEDKRLYDTETKLKFDDKEIELGSTQYRHGKYMGDLQAEVISVIFCNKLYRGVGFGRWSNEDYFWSKDRFLGRLAKERGLTARVARAWWDHSTKDNLDDFFTPKEVTGDLLEFMMSHKISIMLRRPNPAEYSEGNFFLANPTGLKKIGFAKALDPYTAFQELSMWIGGVLGGNSPEILHITDNKILAESHGFDKYSFRGPRI